MVLPTPTTTTSSEATPKTFFSLHQLTTFYCNNIWVETTVGTPSFQQGKNIVSSFSNPPHIEVDMTQVCPPQQKTVAWATKQRRR